MGRLGGGWLLSIGRLRNGKVIMMEKVVSLWYRKIWKREIDRRLIMEWKD